MSSRLDMPGALDAPAAGAPAQSSLSHRERIEQALATVFGLVFMALAVIVTVETISRKVFNFSLQGADELGGYALAVGSTIAFSLGVMGRNHIRVDVFFEMFSPRLKALLNWLSIVSMAAFAVLIAVVAFRVIGDTLQYRSTAPTPWQTPLIYPQAVWYTGLAIFALVTVGSALRATALLFGGQVDQLNVDFQPKSSKQELKEELDDLSARQAAEGGRQ
jgi:TRAP-type C4-dicarboxylate transport system permease small subunit